MAAQARAEVTRQKVMHAAVELFTELGFGGTSIKQILRRSQVTPGAFYHHFASKEEVAFAIIEDASEWMVGIRRAFLQASEARLETVILMTFQLGALLDMDLAYRVAPYLEHTVARHTKEGSRTVAERLEVFVLDMAHAVAAAPLRKGIGPEQAARTIVTLIYGCLAMIGLSEGDAVPRLAESWQVLLPGLVAPDALPHFESVLAQTIDQFGQRSNPAQNKSD